MKTKEVVDKDGFKRTVVYSDDYKETESLWERLAKWLKGAYERRKSS